jgi:hypothetical protein
MAAQANRLKKQLIEIYDDYRKILLSKKYYAHRLEFVKRSSLGIELLLAISASSSFASLKVDRLSPALPYLSAAVALVAILKPLLGLDKEIERLSKLTATFAELFERMKRIVSQISIDDGILDQSAKKVEAIQAVLDRLASGEDMKPKRYLVEKYQNEVEREIPASGLWWPKTAEEPATKS